MTRIHQFPFHLEKDKRLKIEKLLWNDGIRDYYLCEGGGVFAVQNNDEDDLGQYIGKLANIREKPWNIAQEVV